MPDTKEQATPRTNQNLSDSAKSTSAAFRLDLLADHARQLETELADLHRNAGIYALEIESLTAQLAEANQRLAAMEEALCTDANVEIAAAAIWAQHMNKLDAADQTPWDEAAPLGRGITLAYAKNALLALDAARLHQREGGK